MRKEFGNVTKTTQKWGWSKVTGFRGATCATVVLCAVGAFATITDVRTWTDATGNHIWGDKDNWEPKVSTSTRNVFPAGRDWEILVTQSDHYYFSLELEAGAGTVTLKGDTGVLTPGTDAFIQIGAGRELNIDGPEFSLNNVDTINNGFINGTLRTTSGYVRLGSSAVFGGDAKVVVEGGMFGSTGSPVATFTNNATLTVRGGLVQIFRATYCSPDAPSESIVRVLMTGGTYWNSDPQYGGYMTQFKSGAHFVNNGGTLLWCGAGSYATIRLDSGPYSSQGQGDAFPDLLPAFGSTLILPSSSTDYRGALHFAVDGDYDVGGTIYATNNTSASTGHVFLDSANVALRGGATIYANALKVNSNKNSANDFEMRRLNLGIGGICRHENAGSPRQYVNFLDGIEFGAWGGDVPRSGAYTTRLFVSLEGPVAYDTQDCFEPMTSRNIDMDCLDLNGVTELKAVGGGIVSLYPSSTGVNELRTVEVGDGTTLAFCTNVAVRLKTMNLKLGSNATLKINLANGDYVDASATAEFGEGAKIVVTGLPAALTEGMFYPVYFAPAGTDPDLAKIEYEGGDWPTGWYLAKRGGSVHLTDGKEPVHSDSNKYSWSGGGSDNTYKNADNWGGTAEAKYNTTGGADIYFNGRKNTDIDIGNTGITQRQWLFGGDAGSFLFSGARVRFQYPSGETLNAPSIANSGKFPVVVSNDLATQGFAVWTAARKQGSISLMGLGCMMNTLSNQHCPLLVAGDVRIGGAYTSEYVRVAANTSYSTSERTTRLTIMPGGSLKVLSQVDDFNERGAGAFAVATRGTLEIDGTQLLLSSNSTHYVDGVLTVNCPLVPEGRQTFRGDGTLTLAGGVSSAAGGVRVEGNLTLVPSDWTNDVALSVKDNVTIAPTGDWTFGSAATLDLVHHSTLTLATGGHKLTLAKPIVSEGDLAVTGDGKVEIAAAGMSFNKVTCADGATLTVAANLAEPGRSVDVLTVREDDASIAFAPEFKVVKRTDAATGRTVYAVKRSAGFVVIMK